MSPEPQDDCQQPCDADCELGPVHCWWAHEPSHKPGWHSQQDCSRPPGQEQAMKCGVCGSDMTPADLEPPTVRNEPDPGNPRVVRPVLSKPIRMDPETGRVACAIRSPYSQPGTP